jgi:hypothetical protein
MILDSLTVQAALAASMTDFPLAPLGQFLAALRFKIL